MPLLPVIAFIAGVAAADCIYRGRPVKDVLDGLWS